MMLLVSAGFKSTILGARSFADVFNGGEIRMFAGARPEMAELGEPSRPLGVVRRIGADTGLRFAMADVFVVKDGQDTWQLRVQQSGRPAWFRLVAAGDAGGYDPDAVRIDGDAGMAGSGAELTVASTPLVAGTSIRIDQFWYTIPPL